MEVYPTVSVLVCNGVGSEAAASKNREKPYAVEYIHGESTARPLLCEYNWNA